MKKILIFLFLFFPTLVFAAANQPYPKSIITYNKTATITTGNTFQTILAAGQRQSISIQNNNATDSCWITFGSGVTQANAAKGSSILLASGQSFTRYYPFTPSDEIEGTCATASDTLYIDVQ